MKALEDLSGTGQRSNVQGAKSLGTQISEGHAFGKHVVERAEFGNLGIKTREEFAELIDRIVHGAREKNIRHLSGGRTAYWDDATGTVVLHNPRAADMGTAFRPTRGRTYFEGLR